MLRTDVVLRREVTQEAHISVYHKKGASAWAVIEDAKKLAEEGDYVTIVKHMTCAETLMKNFNFFEKILFILIAMFGVYIITIGIIFFFSYLPFVIKSS